MWYLLAGKLMSLITYFVFYKLLITPYDLNLLNRVFGWFLIEHVYEEYHMTAGEFFFINSDFRTLIKNLLIVVRNILTWSHILTLTEFTLTVSILILLMYFLFHFLKINKIKSKKTEIIILIYYTFVTLSTLGYGDVVPSTPQSQAVSLLIAISGQFYMVIIVAAIVGKYISGKNKD